MKYILNLIFLFSLSVVVSISFSIGLAADADVVSFNTSGLTPSESINIRRLVAPTESTFFTHFHTLSDLEFKDCKLNLEITQNGTGMTVRFEKTLPDYQLIEIPFVSDNSKISYPGDMLREVVPAGSRGIAGNMYQYLLTKVTSGATVDLYLLKYLFVEGVDGISNVFVKKWRIEGEKVTLESDMTCIQ